MEVEIFQGWNHGLIEGSPPLDSSFWERWGGWPKWPVPPSDFGVPVMLFLVALMPTAAALLHGLHSFSEASDLLHQQVELLHANCRYRRRRRLENWR